MSGSLVRFCHQCILLTCYGLFSTTNSAMGSLPMLMRQNSSMKTFQMHMWPFFVYQQYHASETEHPMQSIISEYFPKMLRNTYESDYHLFPYYNTDLANTFSRFQREYILKDIPSSLFCPPSAEGPDLQSPNYPAQNSANQTSKFHYYSGDIMQDEFKKLRDDLPIQNLFKDIRSMRGLTAHVWMGEPTVKATMHYDAVHNVFVQLHGQKRMRLISPYSIKKMKMYGRYHPFSCQSRYEDPSIGKFIRSNTFSVIDNKYYDSPPDNAAVTTIEECACDDPPDVHEVLLNPMDILYIPPYWLHDAVSESCSISVSLWWETFMANHMEDIMSLPLPIEEEWSNDQTICITFRYLKRVLLQLNHRLDFLLHKLEHPSFDIKSVVKSLLHDRYDEEFKCSSARNGHKHQVESCTTENSVNEKIEDYSSHAAIKFMEIISKKHGAIHYNSIGFFESDLQKLMGEDTHFQTINHTSDVDQKVNDLLSVMSVKVADYIEDVLMFVSRFLKLSSEQYI